MCQLQIRYILANKCSIQIIYLKKALNSIKKMQMLCCIPYNLVGRRVTNKMIGKNFLIFENSPTLAKPKLPKYLHKSSI